MNVFDRGDYRAFLVVAPADNLDNALFAFPIFEGEVVSHVFKYYQALYFPKAARVEMRANDMDQPLDLGLVHADVFDGSNAYKVSTIHPGKALWRKVVAQWEDQWVFDHLVATTGAMPDPDRREFKGGREIQRRVASTYYDNVRRYVLIVLTGFVALIALSSIKSNSGSN